MQKNTQPKVSIVIPTYKRNAQLMRLIDSISRSNYPKTKIEIIIIDNANDILSQNIKNNTQSIVIKIYKQKTNILSGGARRKGSEYSSGEFVLFIDDDNILEKNCIKHLVNSFSEYKNLGIAAPLMMIWNNKNIIWAAGGVLRRNGLIIVDRLYKDKDVRNEKLPQIISGADYFPNAFMVKKSVLERVKFDDNIFPSAWNETDFALRVKNLGLRLLTITNAREWHDIDYFGATTRLHRADGIYNRVSARILFRKRYYNSLKNWMLFWVITFPISTLYYFKNILLSSGESKSSRLKAYIKGTYDGVRRPAKEIKL